MEACAPVRCRAVTCAPKNQRNTDEKELAVLFYMNGEYGDIVGSGVIQNILELDRMGSTADIFVAAQIGFKPTKCAEGGASYDVRRYSFGAGTPPRAGQIADEGVPDAVRAPAAKKFGPKRSITEPEMLRRFVAWGIRHHKARHYIIVYQGHGSAFRGALGISPAAMAQAVSDGVDDANRETGRHDKIDAQVFNTCLLSSFEALVQMRHASPVTIASEDVAQVDINDDWNGHLEWLSRDIRRNHAFDARRFARYFVNLYREWQREGKSLSNAPDGMSKEAKMQRISDLQKKIFSYKTVTAIDNGKMSEVEAAMREFVRTCASAGVPARRVFEAIRHSRNFNAFDGDRGGDYHYSAHLRDLGDIMQHVKDAAWADDRVRTAAARVQQCVKESIIDEQHEGLDGPGLHGMTIWAPVHAGVGEAFRDEYRAKVPAVFGEGGWGPFLEAAFDASPAALRSEFQALEAEKMIKHVGESLTQRDRMESYPSWIEREQAGVERKQRTLERTTEADKIATLQREIDRKKILIERLQRELDEARQSAASTADALTIKMERLRQIDPLLDLAG